MITRNTTIKHKSGEPVDDRPEYLRNGKPYLVAVDTETTGGDWFDGHQPFITTASDYDRDMLFQLMPHPGGVACDVELICDRDAAALRKLLLETAEGLIFHNASFDIHMLVAAGIVTLDEILARPIHDTEQMARILIHKHDTPDFKLKTLAEIWVDEKARDAENDLLECMVSLGLIQKANQKKKPSHAYYEAWKHYRDVTEAYALYDTRCTYDLFHVLAPKMNDNNRRVYGLERQVMGTLIRMEHRGVPVDTPAVDPLKVEFEQRLAETQAKLGALNGGEPVDVNSKTSLVPFLQRYGVELTDKTDSGDIRLDKWVLEKHAAGRDDVAEVVAEIVDARTSEKFLSTYIYKLDGRALVHCSFIQQGAWTGRTACANPNMQNIPVRKGNEVRALFVPGAPGWSLIVADYSSIELRLLDYYMGETELRPIIRSGKFFEWLGEQLYGTSDPSKWDVPRQPLKNGTYAMFYGAGGPKFASTVGGGMTDQQGRDTIKAIKGALGKPYRALNSRIRRKINGHPGYVRTLGGRQQRTPPDKEYVGLNALIQGSAADIMKLGMVRAERELAQYDAQLLLTVHDELVARVPTENAEAALACMIKCMESSQDLDPKGQLQLVVEGTICHNNYGEAK